MALLRRRAGGGPLPAQARQAAENRYGRTLFPLSVASVLRWARSAEGAVLLDAVPRYLPGWSRPLLRIPVLREFATWNCS